MITRERNPALERAIKAIGGVSATARALGLKNRQAVSAWDVCPPLRVLDLERATGGAVTRHELRPDLYPIE